MEIKVDPNEAKNIEAFMQKASKAGYSEDEIKAAIERKYPKPVAEPEPQPRQWSDVPLEALRNIPESAGEFASGIYQAVRHPVDTAENLLKMGAGAVRNTIPEGYQSQRPEALEASQTADAVGQFYKDRYGSMEGLKGTLATDPVGALSDASMVLTGGAAALPKASRLASMLKKGGQIADPVNIANKAIRGTGTGLGNVAAEVVGGLGTRTGGESIRQAAKAGFSGGESLKTLTQNMRGQVPMTDVLETAKSNLDDMGRAKSAEYRAGMAKVSGDKTVLDFKGIDDAIRNAAQNVTFKGQVKNQKAAEVLQKIADDVNQWKNLDPSQYHTPEGLDALKQRVGAMVESIPFEEKTARMVGNKIYHSIKGEITKQAPVYSDVMKNYSEATEQIREIERALTGTDRTSVDTAMRKLQSVMRNNANTNYGNRLDLMKQLEAQGGREVMPALAGQALNTWEPRGIGNAVAGMTGLGGYALGGPAGAAATLAVQSPRLMGETAVKAGQMARLLDKASKTPAKLTGGKVDPATLANMLYQAGRLPQ